MNIIERLVHTRKAAKLSQEDFAKQVGVGKSTQIRYEKGEVWPAVDYLKKVAETFPQQCDYEWLVTGVKLTGAEHLTRAMGVVLTALYKSLGMDDDAMRTVLDACQSNDDGWSDLLTATTQRAGVEALTSDEKEVLENYRQANAEGKRHLRTASALLTQRQRAGIAKKA